ncbi:MAG: restriction endonuclease subunit S [Candidatus Omnitrophica bacterium]|nr:restriction endonuclease subunit S [Candidatus Omnitrophota bacterium]
MDKVNILDAVNITNNRVKPFEGTKRYLATGDLSGDQIDDSIVSVDYKTKPSRADLLVRKGNVIVARMQATNKVLLIDESTVDLIVSTGFLTLAPKDSFDEKYLSHYFSSPVFQRDKDKFCSGATQKAINNGSFGKLQVPKYSLTDQEAIADKLDEAEILRQKRKEQLALLDDYLKSAFLEMFGNPINNPKGWKLAELQEVCSEIYRYPTFYGFKYVENGIPVVKIGNILQEGIVNPDLSKYSFVTKEISESYPRTILELHDILMAVRGDGSTVKRIGLVYHENLVGANISPNLLRFNTDKDIVLPIYLYMLITSPAGQQLLSQYITQTAKKTITATDIKQIKIPAPPLKLQEQYSKVFFGIQETKQKMRASLDEMDNHFNALMQRYFE